MPRQKIPIKFHIEVPGNKVIFDEYLSIHKNDELIMEHHIDEKGNIYTTAVYIRRGTIDGK